MSSLYLLENYYVLTYLNLLEMVVKILGGVRKTQEEKRALIKQVDKQRWTPLHCAAYFDSYYIVKVLLDVDRSIAYMKDAKGMTALHIAAHQGCHCVMESILRYCPDCCELVDERGWNALHFVVNSSSSYWAEFDECSDYALQFVVNSFSRYRAEFDECSDLAEYLPRNILRKSSISNLLNEKDARGNTPLHHHSNSLHYIKDVMCHVRVDKMAFNKQNRSAYDVALTSKELSEEKVKEYFSLFHGIFIISNGNYEDVVSVFPF